MPDCEAAVLALIQALGVGTTITPSTGRDPSGNKVSNGPTRKWQGNILDEPEVTAASISINLMWAFVMAIVGLISIPTSFKQDQ